MKRNDLPEVLFSKMNMVAPYPENVVEIPQMIGITAFYPGGPGLWLEGKSDKWPDIMVVGQDFSTADYYEKMRAGYLRDLDCPTWKNLLLLFKKTNINPCNCFFTNAFMGLRKEGSITGEFSGMKDKAFTRRNIEYLKYQIEAVSPKVIIVLGIPAAKMFSSVSDELITWKEHTFSYLDENEKSVFHDVIFKNTKFSCVCLLHPSLRNINLKHRKFKEYKGNEAEIMMIKEVMSRQGI